MKLTIINESKSNTVLPVGDMEPNKVYKLVDEDGEEYSDKFDRYYILLSGSQYIIVVDSDGDITGDNVDNCLNEYVIETDLKAELILSNAR